MPAPGAPCVFCEIVAGRPVLQEGCTDGGQPALSGRIPIIWTTPGALAGARERAGSTAAGPARMAGTADSMDPGTSGRSTP